MRPLVAIQLAMFDLGDRLRSAQRASKDRGASAVEYALLIALIAAIIVAAVWALGRFVFRSFENTCTSLANSAGAGITCDSVSLSN